MYENLLTLDKFVEVASIDKLEGILVTVGDTSFTVTRTFKRGSGRFGLVLKGPIGGVADLSFSKNHANASYDSWATKFWKGTPEKILISDYMVERNHPEIYKLIKKKYNLL